MEERFLTLMRHGKASRDFEGLTDFDRPLTAGGVQDAVSVHKHLVEAGVEIDFALISPARRARITGEIVAGLYGLDPSNLHLEERLYLSEPEQILGHLRALPGEVRSALLVAHNPGVQELAAHLSDGRVGRFPTSGTAVFRLRAQQWGGLSSETVELIEVITPKEGRSVP